ncbi:hypothetical protein ACUN3E_18740 [Streptomyces sp. Ju416(a)]|uniref:hypothetical protein n=1 Tax=unclassified Streptomyces TaxID=2593676 RepID=UPI000D508DB0|nr:MULTISPECIES: hypothetical protein [unclassified Streptomyces]PVC85262.1 hypothetical protein DBP20_16170 [Streptomyces sp. CS131]PVC95462.1 hypothetical protein DBP12_18490 [Streptomyces sp. CS014]
MSAQQPPPPHRPHPPGTSGAPGVPWGFVQPRPREVTADYRRKAAILTWSAIVVGALMAVALVVSVIFLIRADQDTRDAAYGYLALVLWVGIAAAVPVLLALAIPAARMRRRVREQQR